MDKYYAQDRLSGMPARATHYILEGLGDIAREDEWHKTELPLPLKFNSLEDALKFIEDKFLVDGEPRIDPEDDRLLIWEVLPTGHKKVVWQFSGWHWDMDEFYCLGQGKLIGHEESLYQEACR